MKNLIIFLAVVFSISVSGLQAGELTDTTNGAVLNANVWIHDVEMIQAYYRGLQIKNWGQVMTIYANGQYVRDSARARIDIAKADLISAIASDPSKFNNVDIKVTSTSIRITPTGYSNPSGSTVNNNTQSGKSANLASNKQSEESSRVLFTNNSKRWIMAYVFDASGELMDFAPLMPGADWDTEVEGTRFQAYTSYLEIDGNKGGVTETFRKAKFFQKERDLRSRKKVPYKGEVYDFWLTMKT